MASCAVRIFDRRLRGHTVQVVVVARPRKNGKIGNADENNGDFRPTLVIFDRFWVKKKPACFCACQCVCARVYVFDFKTRLAISVLPCGSCNYSKYSREQRVKACEKRRENRSLSFPLSLFFLLIFRRLRLAFCCCAAFVCMCVSCVRVRMYV